MISKRYFPLLKTTVSEIRALRQLNCTEESNLHPIFELTKSRKSKNDEMGNVFKRIEEISDIVKKNHFILDLTSEDSLSNSQIESFFDDHNGFENWCLFIESLKDKELNVVPVIQSYDDTSSQEIAVQMKFFHNVCKNFAIRIKPEYLDMDISTRLIEVAQGYDFTLILDFEYIEEDNIDFVEGQFVNFIQRCIQSGLGLNSVIICSSSFPALVNHNNKETGKIDTFEKQVYSDISSKFPALNFFYGDYGSVHPFRNDITAYNWVPRIDFPLNSSVIFFRKRREEGGYKECANKLVASHEFKKNPVNCWGYQEVEDACTTPNGKSPSYWISVRINLHISRTLEWISTQVNNIAS